MDTTINEVAWVMERANRQEPRALQVQAGIAPLAVAVKSKSRLNPYAHTKTGYRPDLGFTVRSGWEANVLRVLKSYDISFEYETWLFPFPIKRGNKSYLPDMYLPATGEYIEVKGFFDNNSKVKMRRFKKFYPEDAAKMILIISKSSRASREFCAELGYQTLYYEEIRKNFSGLIRTWE